MSASDPGSETVRASSFAAIGTSMVIGAALGFAQSIFVVRSLGVELYGVIGIFAATMGIAANALDLRVNDMAMKLFYPSGHAAGEASKRLGVIVAAFLTQAVLALLLFFATWGAIVMVMRFFPGHEVNLTCIALFAAGEALVYAGQILVSTMRFAERFGFLAAVQIVTAAVRAGTIVLCVAATPTVEGYALGLFLAGLVTLVTLCVAAASLWWHVYELRPTSKDVRHGLHEFARHWRSLIAFNAMNYQNLLHRAGDVMLVAFLAGERGAGLYKLARTLTDTLYMLYEMASKVVQPALMRWLSAGEIRRFRDAAMRIGAAAVAMTGVVLLGEWLLLEPFLALAFGAEFVPAAPLVMWLTTPFVFVTGIYLWAWPLILHRGGVATWVKWSMASVLVGQYLIGIGGWWAFGAGNIAWFAAGYALSYPLLYLGLGTYLLRRPGELSLTQRELATF